MLNQKRLPKATAAIVLTVASLVSSASAVLAETVTLEARDGSNAITGQLSSYSEALYVIQTELGELTIHAHPVKCVGATCPSEAEVQADLKAYCPKDAAPAS